MIKKKYDTLIIGHVSIDEIIYDGEVTKMYGGAVVYSGYSAMAGGNKTGILTKTSEQISDMEGIFNVPRNDLYTVNSSKATSIRNNYLSADRERRICTALSVADPFKIEDVPKVDSEIYHLAGLIAGDYEGEIIKALSQRGKVAVDVQGFLRKNINGEMIFEDWEEKLEYLPYIHFLKTDAAEAEIMTGLKDRREAAKLLHRWGAMEIMITYNTEALVYDGSDYYMAPLKPRNLSGRTGRGDTCFSAYITERLKRGPAEAVLYAAALVSLKMETPGPFKGTRADVEKYINQFY
jgi:sugar/nucleoside kinase (ribokinase family)